MLHYTICSIRSYLIMLCHVVLYHGIPCDVVFDYVVFVVLRYVILHLLDCGMFAFVRASWYIIT